MNLKRSLNCLVAAILGLCLSATVHQSLAATPGFTEDFELDVANWVNFDNTAFLSFNATGGPDGSSFASGDFNFKDLAFGDQGPVILRATTTPLGPASGGNFFGDWLTDGITEFSAQVRHNAPVPLTFFARFASPTFFPGAIAVRFQPVFPNTWTEMSFDIDPSNPAFVSFEGETFVDVFDGIGNVQIGVEVPAALAGVDQGFTFDVDQVSIVPEPSSLVLASLAVLACVRRRRI